MSGVNTKVGIMLMSSNFLEKIALINPNKENLVVVKKMVNYSIVLMLSHRINIRKQHGTFDTFRKE